MQLISLPSKDGWWHVAATSPGLDMPSVGKLSSASLQQIDNLGGKNTVKIG